MNDTASETHAHSVAMARAVRFRFAAIVVGMSCPNINFALGLGGFRAVLQDMTMKTCP